MCTTTRMRPWEGSIMCNPPRLYQGRDMTRYVQVRMCARGVRACLKFSLGAIDLSLVGGHRYENPERNGSTQLLSRPGVPIASPVPPPVLILFMHEFKNQDEEIPEPLPIILLQSCVRIVARPSTGCVSAAPTPRSSCLTRQRCR